MCIGVGSIEPNKPTGSTTISCENIVTHYNYAPANYLISHSKVWCIYLCALIRMP